MNRLVNHVKNMAYFLLIFLFNRFPIKSNKIFLFSYYGNQYGDNPKYITEYILQHVPEGTFDLVWAFVDPQSKEHLKGFRIVKRFSIKYFYELCTSKVVITNYRTTEFFKKRKNQYYIQTWHSSLRLKQIEKDAEKDLPLSYIKMAIKDSQKCDLLLSGCKNSTNIFQKAFWYEGKIFEHGTPRNDVLFVKSTTKRLSIKKALDLPSNVRVITYAPTFRKDHGLDVYKLDFMKILNKLNQEFGGEWAFLVRLHPHLIHHSSEIILGDRVFDVTAYDDIQEILYVSDVLITDYSSLMFDFAITTRPCFLYVPDLDDYIEKERHLYFNIEELPFIKALSEEEILTSISSFDRKSYLAHLQDFLKRVGSFESGNACEQLVTHINNVCSKTRMNRINSYLESTKIEA